MARKLFPARDSRDDILFDELFYRQHILEHADPVVSVTTPSTPGTEFAVEHQTGRVPRGYILLRSSSPVVLYDGVSPWTTTQIFLRANAANVNVTFVIV